MTSFSQPPPATGQVHTDGTGTPPLLEVQDLRTHFPIRRGILSRIIGHVKAVDGVSFTVPRGKTLGLDRKSTRLNSSH